MKSVKIIVLSDVSLGVNQRVPWNLESVRVHNIIWREVGPMMIRIQERVRQPYIPTERWGIG